MNGNGKTGPSWKWLAGTFISICLALIGVFGAWYIKGNFDHLHRENIQRQQEIAALGEKIIGKDRYTSDINDIKRDLGIILQLHIKNGSGKK